METIRLCRFQCTKCRLTFVQRVTDTRDDLCRCGAEAVFLGEVKPGGWKA